MLNKLKKSVRSQHLIKKKDRILVGVSGGPDSLALLHILNSLKNEMGFSLYAAHLDHMMRKGSFKDREFVEKACLKLGIPVICGQINVKKLIKKGSVEEAARNVRLNFLFDTAKKFKATKIALGHNLDDQAETVLMRILRGSGLYGLQAILPQKKISGFLIIRPLLGIKRKEISLYLKKKKISPRLDFTNKQDIYLRNRIRNKLMPQLERQFNPNIKDVLSNMAENSAVDYDFLSKQAERESNKLGRVIDLNKFSRLHQALQRLVLRTRVSELKGDTRRLTFQHIKELEDLIAIRPENSVVDLPRGISVVKRKKKLNFFRR